VSIELFTHEEDALSSAWKLQRSGNFVAAFDIAQEGLNLWPKSLPLQHVAILALASCGSTNAALAAYRASDLRGSTSEDFLSLEARLLKDLAFLASGADAAPLLVQAAEAYERIADRTRGTYPAQNAALLWALAGHETRATRLAAAGLAELARLPVPADPEAAYFHWAMVAEAALVMRDKSALSQGVAAANTFCRRNLWARTRTFAQMRRLLHLRDDCVDILDRWHLPAVGFVWPADEPFLFEQWTSLELEADAPVLVYAAGPGHSKLRDELTALDSDLHVIMPNAPVDGISPRPAQLVLNRQASGQRPGYTWSSLLLDDVLDEARCCAEVALGLSLGFSEALHAPWVLLRESAGRWRQYTPRNRTDFCRAFVRREGATQVGPRYALFFADAVGYSTLSAPETRRYWSKLLPETGAAVLRRHANDVVFRKTWGDAIHGVFRSATSAARAALEMIAATTRLNEDFSPGRRLEFRMALHYGAVDVGMDPIEETQSYFGPQLSLAARVVPVVPPGGVFVTESFAAQLSLEGARDLTCTYVGATELAKAYGRVRLLALAWRH
jgi:class 3 adenylate cyclase